MSDETLKPVRQPRGIPGKWFAVSFVTLLTVLGGVTFAIAMRFQSIMSRVEESRSLWPNASQELASRYSSIDQRLATSPESARAAWTKSWQDFQASSLFDRQAVAALELEAHLRGEFAKVRSEAVSETPSVAKLLDAEHRRSLLQNDTIGWLTIQTLRLRLPPIFERTP